MKHLNGKTNKLSFAAKLTSVTEESKRRKVGGGGGGRKSSVYLIFSSYQILTRKRGKPATSLTASAMTDAMLSLSVHAVLYTATTIAHVQRECTGREVIASAEVSE